MKKSYEKGKKEVKEIILKKVRERERKGTTIGGKGRRGGGIKKHKDKMEGIK